MAQNCLFLRTMSSNSHSSSLNPETGFEFRSYYIEPELIYIWMYHDVFMPQQVKIYKS